MICMDVESMEKGRQAKLGPFVSIKPCVDEPIRMGWQYPNEVRDPEIGPFPICKISRGYLSTAPQLFVYTFPERFE